MASERVQRRIERLLDQIEEAADQQNWEREHALAEEVLALDPDNQDAQTFLVAAERSLSRTSDPSSPEAPSPVADLTPPQVAVVSDQPTSFANGRYQVKRFLGEGGKKRVYLAQDTLLDREVAFALIKTESPLQHKGSRQAFISHVSEDSAIALQVANALEAKGFSTWYYERDSIPGPAYLAQMGDAIEQCQAVVLKCTKNRPGEVAIRRC